MGVIKAAIADGVLTFLWVLCSSSIGVSTYFIASSFGVVNEMASLFITTLIVFLIFLLFGFLGDALGGAGFNPTGNAAFYAAGLGGDSLVSAAVRCPAQVAGAVAGSLAIMELMPKQYHHMLEGPILKVDVQAGAIAEGVLTFIITFMVFVIVLRGPKSALLKNWLLTMVTVPLVVAGSKYTGPSMNPANYFAFTYLCLQCGEHKARNSGVFRNFMKGVQTFNSIWLGLPKQYAQHMGTLSGLLDQSLRRSSFGRMDFSFSISVSSEAEASEAKTELNKIFLLPFILRVLNCCSSLSTKDGLKMLLQHSYLCTFYHFIEILKDICPFQ